MCNSTRFPDESGVLRLRRHLRSSVKWVWRHHRFAQLIEGAEGRPGWIRGSLQHQRQHTRASLIEKAKFTDRQDRFRAPESPDVTLGIVDHATKALSSESPAHIRRTIRNPKMNAWPIDSLSALLARASSSGGSCTPASRFSPP